MSIMPSDVSAGPAWTFDLNTAPVNPTSNVNAGTTGGGFGQGITDFFGGLASLFDNGVNIYKSVAGQWAAAQSITKQTTNPQLTTVVVPGAGINTNTIIKIGIIVGIGALALFLIKQPKGA